MPYYSVKNGYKPGIYNTWDECKQQTNGFHGALFKKFNNKQEAENFLNNGSSINKNMKLNKIDKYFKYNPEINIDTNNEEVINIYTDGSLINKNNNIWCGYGIYIPSKNIEISEIVDTPKTNNRAELLAIINCLKYCKESDNINIYTDSRYCIYICTGTGLKYKNNNFMTKSKNGDTVKVPNEDLIINILKLLTKYNIKFHYIKAHTTLKDCHSKGNKLADTLAVIGSMTDMLNNYTKNNNLESYQLNFGKYNGHRLDNIPKSYLNWTQTNTSFNILCKSNKITNFEKVVIGNYLKL